MLTPLIWNVLKKALGITRVIGLHCPDSATAVEEIYNRRSRGVIHFRPSSSIAIEKTKTNVAEPGKNVAKIGETFNVSSLGVQ